MVSKHSDDENTSTEAKDTNTANRKAGKTADAGRAVNASEKTEKTGKPARKDAPALGLVGMLRWCWTQLTKMNTALMLLLLLAVAAVPGSIFPQRVQDPTKVTDYIKNHPGWGEFADKIQLFDVFSSAWFSAIYLLLFISLIGCVTPRAIKHAKDWRKPPARTPRNLSRMPVHRQLEIPVADAGLNLSARGAIEDAARILKKSHYRVEIRDEENEHYSVGAERGYLREIGNILFHVAMIGILVGVAFGSLYGYRGQKILVQDETFVNSLIGYDSFTPGTNYNPDWLTPYAVTLNNFQVRYDRQQDSHTYGQDLDYKAELAVHAPQGGTERRLHTPFSARDRVDGRHAPGPVSSQRRRQDAHPGSGEYGLQAGSLLSLRHRRRDHQPHRRRHAPLVSLPHQGSHRGRLGGGGLDPKRIYVDGHKPCGGLRLLRRRR